jgi:hypothetical protein
LDCSLGVRGVLRRRLFCVSCAAAKNEVRAGKELKAKSVCPGGFWLLRCAKRVREKGVDAAGTNA